MDLTRVIRAIPDFPKPGIVFRDITPLLGDPAAFEMTITEIVLQWTDKIDAVVGLDARGFIFGGAVAYEMGLPFVPVRKKGKLPAETVEVEYALEYGSGILQMHKDAVGTKSRVLIVDDLLATGGTAAAAASLVEKVGAKVAGYAFVIELAELEGRNKLHAPIQSLAIYGEAAASAAA